MNRAVILSIALLGIAFAPGCGSDNVAQPTAATPTPTPAPTPEPTPEPQATGCSLDPNPECGSGENPPGSGQFGCCKEESLDTHGQAVEDALAEVLKDPSWLDGEGRVKDEDAFVQAVAAKVEELFPLCATQGGPPDEIGVKGSNDLSEQFDIVFGSGHPRNHGYTVTCRPARF